MMTQLQLKGDTIRAYKYLQGDSSKEVKELFIISVDGRIKNNQPEKGKEEKVYA